MSENTREGGFSQSLALIKEVLSVLKEAILPILFVILLVRPAWINSALENAGFTEGSIAGLKWQKRVEQAAEDTREAGKYVAQIEDRLAEIRNGLENISSRVSPSVKPEVDSLLAKITESQDKTKVADQTLKQSLVTQEEVIEKKSPQNREILGWIYLGKVNEGKTAWEPGYPKSIVPVDVAQLPDARLTISDDVYLRGDVSSGSRSAAAVLSVVRVGERVRTVNLDFSRARGGGWFVWAQVQRISN